MPQARWFSPVRLLMTAILLLVLGTAALTVHLTRRGSLAVDILAARAAWTTHLEAGDFAKARTVLDQASAEISRYSGASRESREVGHLAREVALFADLSERSIEELFHEVRSISSQDAASLRLTIVSLFPCGFYSTSSMML